MVREITIKELEQLAHPVLVDVRSEGEYEEATIPGSINIPLLNNKEREKIGTIYAQKSPSIAKEEGLEIVSPKLPSIVKKINELGKGNPIVLFCWRGGMRSKSLTTVLDLMGVPVYKLNGGYKAYRHLVNEYFNEELPFKVFVLRGNTGIGKTELLKKLRQDGYPAIDLEKLANNRGSVFGSLGLGEPPSQKKFESSLYDELKELSAFPYIIVECESKRIGRVTLPVKFFEAMQKGIQVLVYDSIQNRVKRLVDEYTSIPNPVPELETALNRLTKNLGHKKVGYLNELLELGNFEEFTVEMLQYYDSLYAYPNQADPSFDYSVSHHNPEECLQKLEEYFDQWVNQNRNLHLDNCGR